MKKILESELAPTKKFILGFLSVYLMMFVSSCRKDEAIREANTSDLINGNFFSFATAAELKILSLAATDGLPSSQDFNRVMKRELTKEQLLNEFYLKPEHAARVGRIFGDVFGIQKSPFVVDESRVLVANSAGLLESSERQNTCTTGPSNVVPWWTDSAVQICSSLQCGKAAVNCIPADLMPDLQKAVSSEISQRSRYTYLQNLNWEDFWGGKWIYGNRYLAFAYAFESRLLEPGSVPKLSDAQETEIGTFLKSFSLSEYKRSTLPSFFPERAGIVTAPQYLKRHNNFRSRTRGLAQAMSCQDISGALNTSNISQFVNADLSAFDKSHGGKESCASCHYPMDNLGSTLLGWSDVGHREFWRSISQNGHVFGQEGEGPHFLMSTWVNQGPQFKECMARQIWKSLSGGRSYDKLSDGKKNLLIQASAKGLQKLVRTALSLPELSRVDTP